MRFDAPEADRRRRLVPALFVLATHALLLSLWLLARGPLQAPAKEAGPMAWLRLLPPAVPVDRPPETAATGPRGPRGGARTAATLAITPQPAAVSPAAPTAAEPPSAAAASTPLPAGPHTAAPPQATLDLSLPRQPNAPWRDRNPALGDPRANTRPPATMEARIAATLGDGRWHVERLDNDRVRYRSGSRCVIATRSRAGQIELAGGAFRDLWALSGC